MGFLDLGLSHNIREPLIRFRKVSSLQILSFLASLPSKAQQNVFLSSKKKAYFFRSDYLHADPFKIYFRLVSMPCFNIVLRIELTIFLSSKFSLFHNDCPQ